MTGSPLTISFDLLEPRIMLSAATDLYGPAGGADGDPLGAADASIAGLVWRDLDNNGVMDGEDYVIAGARVLLESNNGPQETVTDADGLYLFDGLSDLIEYHVHLDAPWEPLVVNPPAQVYMYTLTPGEQVADADFTLNWVETPVFGQVFTRDLGSDIPIGGARVYADLNDNHLFDADEPDAITDAQGQYNIPHLPPFDYTLALENIQGTTVVAGAYRNISLTSAQQVDFEVVQYTTVSGIVWSDTNLNGLQDQGEWPRTGQFVYADVFGGGDYDQFDFMDGAYHLRPDTVEFGIGGQCLLDLSIETDLRLRNDGATTGSFNLRLVSPYGQSILLLDGYDVESGFDQTLTFRFSDSGFDQGMELALDGEAIVPAEPFAAFFNKISMGRWRLMLETQDTELLCVINGAQMGGSIGEPATVSDSAGNFTLTLPAGRPHTLRCPQVNGQADIEAPVGLPLTDVALPIDADVITVQGRVGTPNGPDCLTGWRVELIDPDTGDVLAETLSSWVDLNDDGTIGEDEYGAYRFADLPRDEYSVRFTAPSEEFGILYLDKYFLQDWDGHSLRRIHIITGEDRGFQPNLNFAGPPAALNTAVAGGKMLYGISSAPRWVDGVEVESFRLWAFQQNPEYEFDYEQVWTTVIDGFTSLNIPNIEAMYDISLSSDGIVVGRETNPGQPDDGYTMRVFGYGDGSLVAETDMDPATSFTSSPGGSQIWVMHPARPVEINGHTEDSPEHLACYDSAGLEPLGMMPLPVITGVNLADRELTGMLDGQLVLQDDIWSERVLIDPALYTEQSINGSAFATEPASLDSITLETRTYQTGNPIMLDMLEAVAVSHIRGQVAVETEPDVFLPVNGQRLSSENVVIPTFEQDLDGDGAIDRLTESGLYEFRYFCPDLHNTTLNVSIYANSVIDPMRFNVRGDMDFDYDIRLSSSQAKAGAGLPELSGDSDRGASDSDNITGIRTFIPGETITLAIPGLPDGVPVQLIVNRTASMSLPYDSSAGGLVLPAHFFVPGRELYLIEMTCLGRNLGNLMMKLDILNGDIDRDGAPAGPNDIDVISRAIRTGQHHGWMDLNLDGVLDAADRAMLIGHENLANTVAGDSNLDGVVDIQDFVNLKRGYGGIGGWADGDFNGDGVVDLLDFVLLKKNYGG